MIYSVILPTLTLITSSFILTAILITLFLIQPKITMYVFGGFGLIYIFISLIVRSQLLSDSRIIARNTTLVLKSLQEGLGGIRDVLIDGSQETYCKAFQNADISLRRAQGNNVFIGQAPRYALEALGMIMISLLAMTLSGGANGMDQIIPILGVLALGAQRLLPVYHRLPIERKAEA